MNLEEVYYRTCMTVLKNKIHIMEVSLMTCKWVGLNCNQTVKIIHQLVRFQICKLQLKMLFRPHLSIKTKLKCYLIQMTKINVIKAFHQVEKQLVIWNHLNKVRFNTPLVKDNIISIMLSKTYNLETTLLVGPKDTKVIQKGLAQV